MEVFEVFEISDDDDSAKDKDFELADNENTDSSEEHDDINVKRKTFETKHARKTEMVIKRKKVSDHEDVYPIKYTDLFRYNKMGSVKIGLCKLCEEKNITTEIKMKLSNTKGLKYHLQKQHLQQYTHYFGQETKPSTSSGASTSQTLTSMFKSQSKSATYKEKAPLPGKNWEGTLDATKVHPICPQRDTFRDVKDIEGEEDCLYLNVYTPQLPNEGTDPLPVMIFFHGGGFYCGGGNSQWYGPNFLLDRDVVLVVTNYRLGALGFLSTGDDVVPGNNGLKDQSLALKWVADNIAKFGGDPKRITLFGESAGGASAHFHMVSPLSKGLFTGAIAQSGTSLCLWAHASRSEAVTNAKKLATALKCPVESSKEMIECLKQTDAEKIVEQDRLFEEWSIDPLIPFKPVVEKNVEGAFLVETPAETIKSGRSANVPLVVGLNTEDGAIRSASVFGKSQLIKELNENWDEIVPLTFMCAKPVEDVKSFAKKIRNFYFGDREVDNSTRDALTNVYTDSLFLNCADETVRLHLERSKAPVYYYLFGYKGDVSFSQIFGDPDADYGVCHADELLYLFPIGEMLFPDKKQGKESKEMSNILTNLWVNFAKSGNPTPEINEVIKAKWEPVKSENMEYYYIDRKSAGMKEGLLLERAKFWRDLSSKLQINEEVHDEL